VKECISVLSFVPRWDSNCYNTTGPALKHWAIVETEANRTCASPTAKKQNGRAHEEPGRCEFVLADF
jgi:hypothetical protein